MHKRLLIITPTLGRSQYFETTVASVQQFSADAHYVVVAPLEAVTRLKEKSNGRYTCEVEEYSGNGLYAAINQVISRHINDFDGFSYINDDDCLSPGFLRLVRTWLSSPAPGIHIGKTQLIDSQGRRIGSIPTARFQWQFRALFSSGVMPLAQQGAIVDMECVRRLGAFDDRLRLCADMELFARAAEARIPIRTIKETVACFRIHAGQLSKNIVAMRTETEAVVRRRPVRPVLMRVAAYSLFVLFNAPVYARRLHRSGFKNSWVLLDNAQ